jgi:hypothetical protein
LNPSSRDISEKPQALFLSLSHEKYKLDSFSNHKNRSLELENLKTFCFRPIPTVWVPDRHYPY